MLLIKAGGGKDLNWEGIAQDIASHLRNQQAVLVHGANAVRAEIADALGIQVRSVVSPTGVSSVFTDQAALDVFLMAYPGLANSRITALLRRKGVNAVGLSGVDGGLWRAKAKTDILVREGTKTKLLRGNLTGRVEEINADLIRLLLENGYFPVVCPPALSHEGEIVNTDNDWAAAVMAEALNVKTMVSLFEAPGLLKDPEDESSLIPSVSGERLEDYRVYAQGRMTKKLLGAGRAFKGGVETIYWGDGRVKSPLVAALAGKGTVIRRA
jgi:acetylglutamate/LysW-gamma-L-alpha-aminoadipate kinase